MSAPSAPPGVTLTVEYDDDVAAAADALLTLLQGAAAGCADPDRDDAGDPERDAA